MTVVPSKVTFLNILMLYSIMSQSEKSLFLFPRLLSIKMTIWNSVLYKYKYSFPYKSKFFYPDDLGNISKIDYELSNCEESIFITDLSVLIQKRLPTKNSFSMFRCIFFCSHNAGK